MLQIFLAHSDEDDAAAADLYYRLQQQGYRPWRRQVDVLPGQSKPAAIARAVKESHVFMACFSRRSINKPGYVQKEFRLALNEQAERPPGSVYLIPVRLDNCEIPDLRQEEYGVCLRNLQWVDLFTEGGFSRLVHALKQAFPEHPPQLTADASLDVSPWQAEPQEVPHAMQAFPTQRPPIQNRWAFLVGINGYADKSFPQLRYCVNDVKSLDQLLGQVGYTVVCLHDELPVRDARFPRYSYIEAEFKQLKDTFGKEDLLLVYFACHGTRGGDGIPRLVAEDTRAETLTDTGIAVADVERWMRESGAGQLVLMLDACHMGQGTDERKAEVVSKFVKGVYERRPEGFALLASSTAGQVAREFGELQHGLFSYHVLSGLAGAATVPDEDRVTVGSLKRYVMGALTREAVKSGVSQMPQGRLQGDLDLADAVLVDGADLALSENRNIDRKPQGATKVTDRYLNKEDRLKEEIGLLEAQLNRCFEKRLLTEDPDREVKLEKLEETLEKKIAAKKAELKRLT